MFYRCGHCGKIVSVVVDGEGSFNCCGEDMKALKAYTSDGAKEKHVPVATVEGNKVVVNVGSVDHPMTQEHYIQFIMIETNLGKQYKGLTPEDKPHAEFVLQDGEKLVAAYEYCNLHGLWKVEV